MYCPPCSPPGTCAVLGRAAAHYSPAVAPIPCGSASAVERFHCMPCARSTRSVFVDATWRTPSRSIRLRLCALRCSAGALTLPILGCPLRTGSTFSARWRTGRSRRKSFVLGATQRRCYTSSSVPARLPMVDTPTQAESITCLRERRGRPTTFTKAVGLGSTPPRLQCELGGSRQLAALEGSVQC